jgi:hypothetical protein
LPIDGAIGNGVILSPMDAVADRERAALGDFLDAHDRLDRRRQDSAALISSLRIRQTRRTASFALTIHPEIS